MFDLSEAKGEIEARNRLHVEVHLPQVAMAQEVRKLYDAERKAAFEAFFNTSPLRRRLDAKLLARIRRQRHEPEWKPTGMLSGGGWAFSNRVVKVLLRVWHRHRRMIGSENGRSR